MMAADWTARCMAMDANTKAEAAAAEIEKLREALGIEHYGIKIDKNNSDTAARVSYLYDCAGFTPAGMDFTNSVFSYGSWANAFFIRKNYPVMVKFDGSEDYKLDPNDHTKKLDGTASDVADTAYGGNAMSVFDCHIWMKFYEDENYQYLEVSNYKLDDDFVDYPYQDGSGNSAEKLYYPMYPGYVDSNNKLRSVSGVKASSGTPVLREVQYAANNGSGWEIGDWSHYLWMAALMLLISKNFNSQAVFGNGNIDENATSESDFKTNGLLNDKGQFFGYSTDNDSMKAFFCENIYANRFQRLLGMYNASGSYKIKMTPPYTADDTFSGYTTVSSPTPPASGWIKDLSFDKSYGILPKTTSGTASSSQWVGDYMYSSDSYVSLLLTGGRVGSSAECGSFSFNLISRSVGSGWKFGASVYLRQAVE